MHEDLCQIPAIDPLAASGALDEVELILIIGAVMVVIPHG
jgi:hypothetical protein